MDKIAIAFITFIAKLKTISRKFVYINNNYKNIISLV